ncbi:MAG: NUDIX domain-containing protein [Nocardioides sp.]
MTERVYNLTTPDGPDPTNPHSIDWATRQARAVIDFVIGTDGLPMNPGPVRDLPAGRGDMWHWGEAVAVDAIVTAHPATPAQGFGDDDTGRPFTGRWLLMIERGDGHGWALPGGHLDPHETPAQAAARELAEETGLVLHPRRFTPSPALVAPDPRAGRNAWVVTIPHHTRLLLDTLPTVAGGDDARAAAWLPANTHHELVDAITDHGGVVFAAHADILRHALTSQGEQS